MNLSIKQFVLVTAVAVTAGVFVADTSASIAQAGVKSGCKLSKTGNTHQCNFTQRRRAKLTKPPTFGARARTQNFRAGGDFSDGRDSEGGNGGGGNTCTMPGAGELQSGQTLSNLNGPEGELLQYYIDVPAGTSQVLIKIWGGSGDADLYVARNREASPDENGCGVAATIAQRVRQRNQC